MTFGDYNYGPEDSDEPLGDDEPQRVDPDNPASIEQCDHPRCSNDTPGLKQRVCDQCDEIMRPSLPDECGFCGVSVSDDRNA